MSSALTFPTCNVQELWQILADPTKKFQRNSAGCPLSTHALSLTMKKIHDWNYLNASFSDQWHAVLYCTVYMYMYMYCT